MSKHGFAFFVHYPRRAEDLFLPHAVEQEREFEVVKTVTLSEIAFENFCTDMVADRLFLGEIVKCILVKSRKSKDWVLVMPEGAYVDLAAVIPAQQLQSS